MRLRSGIRCDVLTALVCGLLTALACAPAALAAPPTETPAGVRVVPGGLRLIEFQWDPPVDETLHPRVLIEVEGKPARSRQLAEWQNYWDEHVTCGETVDFTVVFENALGESGPPATLTKAVEPCEPGPPQGSYLTAAGVSGGSVGLAWGDSPSNDIAEMEVRTTWPDGFTTSKRIPWPLTGTAVGGLACGTRYAFALTFIDFDGLRSTTGDWSAETDACETLGPAPDAPANLHLVGAASKTATLEWDPAAAAGVAGAVIDVGAPSGLHETFHLTAAPAEPTQITVPLAACGHHLATVKVFYENGRVSKAATLPLEPPCPAPRPKQQSGPVPYHRAGITLHRQAKVTVTRNGAFVLPRDTVQCPAVGGDCRVIVRVETRIPGRRGLGPVLYLGDVETTLAPQAVRTLKGRLSPRGRALLLRRGRLRVTITIEAWHVAGLYGVTKHTTLVPARR